MLSPFIITRPEKNLLHKHSRHKVSLKRSGRWIKCADLGVYIRKELNSGLNGMDECYEKPFFTISLGLHICEAIKLTSTLAGNWKKWRRKFTLNFQSVGWSHGAGLERLIELDHLLNFVPHKTEIEFSLVETAVEQTLAVYNSRAENRFSDVTSNKFRVGGMVR